MHTTRKVLVPRFGSSTFHFSLGFSFKVSPGYQQSHKASDQKVAAVYLHLSISGVPYSAARFRVGQHDSEIKLPAWFGSDTEELS